MSRSDDDGSAGACRSPFASTSTSPVSEKKGDVLLPWVHKKRSRISRTEIHAQPLHRVRRRPPAGLVMPPPLPKSSPPLGDGRNLEDQLIAGNGSSSSRNRGGGGLAVSRSAPGKRFSSSSKDVKTNGSLLHVIDGAIVSSPAQQQQQQPKRQAGAAKTTTPEKTNFKCPRIYLTLSRKEKEDDFLAMKGTKLPQRPKKRAKNIDKALQYCYPGMWLADLTRSRYQVREKKQQQKRRGLKGMESLDSDSY